MKNLDIVCVYDNERFAAPIGYTFDLLLSTFGVGYRVMPLRRLVEGGCPRDALVMSYGRDVPDLGVRTQIHIYASDFFGKDYLKPACLPQTPLKKHEGLPVIYSGGGVPQSVRQSGGLLETSIDIVASSFFMVSRYEEVVQDVKDEHDRFPASASIAFREGFLDRPIVNEYIELLWGWVQALAPALKRRVLWPQNKEFAVCLTHDVDSLRKYALLPPVMPIGGLILRQRKLRSGLAMAAQYLGTALHLKKDPLDTFDYMLALEHRYGFKSSFYFMAGGDSEYDGGYSLTERRVVKLMKRIQDTGCEVGLHPGYNSYNRVEHMLSEKSALDRVVSNTTYGCRQHYLRWSTPDTWRLQERAGLLYDSTLGFADHVGFRCGLCLPFRPFDIMENRALNLWELPLTVQEGTLHGAPYQNLGPAEAYEETAKLIQAARQCHGVFVLLWHNSSFDSPAGWGGWKEVYERLMHCISNENAWVASARDIVQWWAQNHTA